MTEFARPKDVQRLTGRIAALSRFVSRLSDRCRPFFQAIKAGNAMVWGEEQQAAFDQLRGYLSSPPILTTPQENEEVLCYLAVSDVAVSAALVVEREGVQQPVYYISKTLTSAETRYSLIEKFVLALVTTKRKLRQYFEAHPIVVITSQPIRAVLAKPDMSGRIAQWAIELGAFDIRYRPRNAMKGQLLADFLLECGSDESGPESLEEITELGEEGVWQLYVDGSSTSHGAGAGIVLISPDGTKLKQSYKLNFQASNNVAEYEALLSGMRLARSLEVRRLRAFSDSQLVVGQFSGEYSAKSPSMEAYKDRVQELALHFMAFSLSKIPREENTEADALACEASAVEKGNLIREVPQDMIDRPSTKEYEDDLVREIPEEEIDQPSINGSEEVFQVQVIPSWMDQYVEYLEHGTLPTNKSEARKLRVKAARYALIGKRLYRRSFDGPYLRCLRPDEAQNVMGIIHNGVCGNHSSGKSLAHKAMRTGYFWPRMMKEAEEFVKKCDKCQRFAPMIHQPAQDLNPISSPWPFARWGLDIVGILPTTPAKKRYVLLATDYFTKWVEAKAYSTVRAIDVKSFIWELICRFGLPQSIVTDNGPQFENRIVQEFCRDQGIKQHFSSTYYPQGNGQAEATNKTIFSNIKKKLEERKGKWAEELPKVLWAYRTSKRHPTGETPFAMAYGTEAVIPTEMAYPTLRSEVAQSSANDQLLAENLNLIEEKREAAVIRLAEYHRQAMKHYNQKVRPREFQVGDLVLRKVQFNTKEPNQGKLAPNWEGPYQIVRIIGKGSYTLVNHEGRPLPKSYNSMNLKKYYR